MHQCSPLSCLSTSAFYIHGSLCGEPGAATVTLDFAHKHKEKTTSWSRPCSLGAVAAGLTPGPRGSALVRVHSPPCFAEASANVYFRLCCGTTLFPQSHCCPPGMCHHLGLPRHFAAGLFFLGDVGILWDPPVSTPRARTIGTTPDFFCACCGDQVQVMD